MPHRGAWACACACVRQTRCVPHASRAQRSVHGLSGRYLPPPSCNPLRYAAFFAVSGAAGARSAGMLAAQLDAIVYPLYDSLRPLVLQQAALEPLCEMVQVVHGEVLQEGVRRSAECAALEGMLERLLQAQQVVAQP